MSVSFVAMPALSLPARAVAVAAVGAGSQQRQIVFPHSRKCPRVCLHGSRGNNNSIRRYSPSAALAPADDSSRSIGSSSSGTSSSDSSSSSLSSPSAPSGTSGRRTALATAAAAAAAAYYSSGLFHPPCALSEDFAAAGVRSAAAAAAGQGDDDDDDDDTPPVISAKAAAAAASVDAAIAASAAHSVSVLASPTVSSLATLTSYLPAAPGYLALPLPPDPVRFPRKPLNVKLSVMLLRSGYEVVDGMRVVPMDQFQIKSWKSRQAEWEPYTYQYSPLKIEQGKLEDPLYFDFVSYVQFQSIGKEFPGSKNVFEERSGAEGISRIIRRDPALNDNKILPAVLAQRLGDTIYARLRYGFEETYFGAPAPCEAEGPRVGTLLDCAQEGMRGIVDVFVSYGYALKGNVVFVDIPGTSGGDGGGAGGGAKKKVTVRLDGPATLWGAQQLASRGSNPPNEYLGYCLSGFLRASGVKSSYTSKQSDTSLELDFTLSR